MKRSKTLAKDHTAMKTLSSRGKHATDHPQPPISRKTVASVFGLETSELATTFLYQTLNATHDCSVQEDKDGEDLAQKKIKLSIEAIAGLNPNDTLESMLCCQMLSVHNLAMEFMRRAASQIDDATFIEINLNRATKLQRTFVAQVEALNKYRNKGKSSVTVTHLNVNQGGQANFGQVVAQSKQGGGSDK